MLATLNVGSEDELRRALSAGSGQLIVSRPSLMPDLDAWRAQCAQHGAEIVADTDARAALLRALREDPMVCEAVEALAAHGLLVRLLPASYAPQPRDRERMSVWLDRDADEGDILYVGVTRTARAAAVAIELKRTESMIGEQPSLVHPLGADILDAARQSFALSWARERGNREEALRCREALGRRLSAARLHDGLSGDEVSRCALRLWAICTGLDSVEALRQIGRIDESVADAARQMLAVCEEAPAQVTDVNAVAVALMDLC